ncbi:hypothetical protein CLV35_1609 [Motilibacter peucedani]|uniref:Pyrroline-5-carboxylate reductase catalytic N-terminal domain-containing protein n=1 Tax=Motilibacter peucedani TaxID=598650 RepID=A0A420XSQ6_9ACTN|nr:NADPH-dependent F420 reductase [Motilibacter peucedani]RKS77906.1 hypothetical protein CLV35_1609 [Motilibacter peucedani]
MTIAILGSGKIGGTLTRRLRALGHEVVVANSRGPASLAQLAAETGAETATVADAVSRADTVVLAVPLKNVPDIASGAYSGRVVIDADNYYPARDGQIAELDAGDLTSSEWTARLLPGARVVKAFNTIRFDHLGERGLPAGAEGRMGIPVAGDDAEAKQQVLDLVEQLGFDAVDAGPLAESWRQEVGAPAYGAVAGRDELARLLASATR